jgi:hypothetical protein
MRCAALVLSMLACLCSAEVQAGVRAVAGKEAPRAKAAVVAVALRADRFPAAALSSVVMAAPPRPALEAPLSEDKRTQVGIARHLTQEIAKRSGPSKTTWVAQAGGGRVARVSVTSAGAGSVRLGLALRGLPDGAQLRVASTDEPARVLGPVDAAEMRSQMKAQGLYWTALTSGATQVVEVWIPDGVVEPTLEARSVSHLAMGPAGLLKASGVGAAQACHEDVVCAARGDGLVDQAARSVAKLLYTENGASFVCTGTLVNDGSANSHVPYVYTAAHCIDSQAAASTVNSFWYFQASQCGGVLASDYRQLSRGATLLFADTASDAALIRLADTAPEGAWFSGWDASPLATGANIIALHHPAGDLKKISIGQSMGATPSTGGSYNTAAWITGSTEGGSSGSGLFTRANDQYVLRGALRGGSASCSSSGVVADPSNRDYYSRLDLVITQLSQWLGGAPAPSADFSGLWFDPAEPGWGVSITQSAENHVFVAWYTYGADSQSTWLYAQQNAWAASDVLDAPLYRTRAAPAASYDAAKFAQASIGTMRLTFGADGSATFVADYDGQHLVKPLKRLAL